MGQTLSYPATHKSSESGGNDRFLYAVSDMQGWRISMEDAHATILNLDEGKEESNTFFAVYDGHGGGTVARFAGQNVHKRLVTEETYNLNQYEAAMKAAFLGTDVDLRADPAFVRDPSGCTAVAALITHDNKIYVANAGDSRSVISVQGEATPLSFDHKPSNDVERTRICGAGGYVECGRVNGNLALSRALGDFEFKKNLSLVPEKQIITADPEVTLHDITEEDEFLILACDGIWDCLSSQEAIDFVRLHISQGKELAEIGELLCDYCLAPDTTSKAGVGCDNMTVLIVAILQGRTKQEWYSWITDRVNRGHGHQTPLVVPQLYPESKLMSFRARGEAIAQHRAKLEQQDKGGEPSPTTFGEFSQVSGSTGGISFNPDTDISDTGPLMFGHDEGDDDESGDEIDLLIREDHPPPYKKLVVGKPDLSSPPHSLRARLDEFEQDTRQEDGTDSGTISHIDDLKVGHMNITEPSTTPPRREDTPSVRSQRPLPNGDTGALVILVIQEGN